MNTFPWLNLRSAVRGVAAKRGARGIHFHRGGLATVIEPFDYAGLAANGPGRRDGIQL